MTGLKEAPGRPADARRTPAQHATLGVYFADTLRWDDSWVPRTGSAWPAGPKPALLSNNSRQEDASL